jgi:hypothetical protein
LPFPGHYRLNISSGSRFDGTPLAESVPQAWPITGGSFVCVPIRGKHAKGFARFDDPNYHTPACRAGSRSGYGLQPAPHRLRQADTGWRGTLPRTCDD